MITSTPSNDTARTSLGRRFKIWLVSELGYWVIRMVGGTLRWKTEGLESFNAHRASNRRIIGAFWHGRIFMATYFFQHMGFVVMTSRNRDGDYIARTIRRFGYGAARGSSTRGGSAALMTMLEEMKRDRNTAFTLDGPRGPRYIAKPGAVWLASKSGAPIYPFNISPEKKWVFRSWDHFQFPKPFTRVFLTMGEPIYVKPEATPEELRQAHDHLQKTMENLLEKGDSYWNPRD